MFCILNILFYHPISEATPDSKITGAYSAGTKNLRFLLLELQVSRWDLKTPADAVAVVPLGNQEPETPTDVHTRKFPLNRLSSKQEVPN